MLVKFWTNISGTTYNWPNLEPMQVAFYLAGEITQVKESIPWVRCASGNDLSIFEKLQNIVQTMNIDIHPRPQWNCIIGPRSPSPPPSSSSTLFMRCQSALMYALDLVYSNLCSKSGQQPPPLISSAFPSSVHLWLRNHTGMIVWVAEKIRW